MQTCSKGLLQGSAQFSSVTKTGRLLLGVEAVSSAVCSIFTRGESLEKCLEEPNVYVAASVSCLVCPPFLHVKPSYPSVELYKYHNIYTDQLKATVGTTQGRQTTCCSGVCPDCLTCTWELGGSAVGSTSAGSSNSDSSLK